MPEERKLVTVLFADIVGSTAIGARHDPEVVRSTLRGSFADVRDVLVAHGGTVEKFIGDAVFAVFGVPVSHEDDAERAVRAAFAIRERIAHRETAFPLELRIGVSSGDAVTSGTEGGELLVSGEPGSMAGRLQQAASPGEILVGPLTRHLTARSIRYGAEREIEAKGFGRVLVAPADAVDAPIPEQRRGLRGARAPLIGRARELAALRDALTAARRERCPRLVTIFGQPGAGKSRLTSEFVATLDPTTVLYGRCLPYGEGIAFYAIQQMLRADAGIDPSDTRGEAERKLGTHVAATFGEDRDVTAVIARLSVLAGIADTARSLPEVASEDIAEELGWGFRRYVERRANVRELTIVIEDIHWAPATVLDLIAALVDRARGPILVLCLARPDLLDSRPGWGAGWENAATLLLGPLSSEDTGSLIAALLDLDHVEDGLRADVIARAEGNPLYVEELLNALVETGRIVRRDGRSVSTPGPPLELPRALQGIIAARLDGVPPEVKRTLQVASVIGRIFSGPAIGALQGAGATAQLREAARRDLVQQIDEGPRGLAGVYRFKHALVRDVAYASLPKTERIASHDRYGRWLEETAGEGREDVAELAAHHADEAFTLAVELRSPDATPLGQRAADRLAIAARRAADRGDLRSARSLWQRVLSIADVVEVPPHVRLEAEGRAALLTDDNAETRVAKLAALEKARAAGPSALLVDLLGFASAIASETSMTSARELSDEALRVAGSVGDPELLARARLSEIANMRVAGSSHLADVLRRCEDALTAAKRDGAKRGALACLSQLAYLEHIGARFGRSNELTIEGEHAAVAAGALLSRFGFLGWRSRNAAFAGRATLALATAHEMRPLADSIGLRINSRTQRVHLGMAQYEAHDLPASRGALEEALDLTDPADAVIYTWTSALLIRTILALGDAAGARKLFDGISGVRVAWAYWRTFRPLTEASVRAAELDHDVADALFREALEAEGHAIFHAHALLEYGRYLVARDRLTDAFPVLSDARAFYADPFAEPRQREIDALLGRCALSTTT